MLSTPARALVLTTVLAALMSVAATAQSPAEKTNVNVVQIDEFQGLAGLLNLAQGTVRIVALVSPTCPLCIKGVEEVHAVLSEIPNPRLRAYIVFMPMLEGDDKLATVGIAGRFSERRAVYFWDPERVTGEAWKGLVGIDTPAWDVYFLYDIDATFSDTPPEPAQWMRQHGFIEGPDLDGAVLRDGARELLKRFEEKQKEAQGQDGE